MIAQGGLQLYYMGLFNQLQFVLFLVFSSYMLFTAITWAYSDRATRVFGIAFVSPLLLSIIAFIAAPADRSTTEFMVYFAGFSLVSVLMMASMTLNDTANARIIEMIAYLFPVPIIILNRFVKLDAIRVVTDACLIIFLIITLIMLIMSIIKHRDQLTRIGGLFALTFGVLSSEMPMLATVPWISVLLYLLGFVLCAVFLYRNTYGDLKQTTHAYARTLDRINQNVQREVIRRVEVIEKSNKKLLEISKTDNLTGAYTKAAAINYMDTMINRAPNAVFSMMMFDLDHFKGINDTMGHQVGDKCLKQLAGIARNSFRTEDIIGRYGGDEFLIILPGANPIKAFMVAERFRQNIEKGTNPKFTVSIGISTYPQDAKDVKSMIESADRALYNSKKRGRNSVSHVAQIAHPPTNLDT